jgi:hypothetical protein
VRIYPDMSTREFAVLILGAILGAVVSVMYNSFLTAAKAWRRRVAVERRAAEHKPGRQAAIAMKYFEKLGRISDLYLPSHIRSARPIPAIMERSPTVLPIITRTSEAAVLLRPPVGPRTEFPVNRRTIQRQTRAGARMFDGTILYVQDRKVDNGHIVFILDRCNYYSYATKMVMLRKELRSRVLHRPIYKNVFATLSPSVATTVEPQAAGCVCITLFPAPGGRYRVIFAHRSAEVAQAANQISALPSFGLESNITAGKQSKYGLFFYNYLREFAEELFNLEELIELTVSKHFGPDWIFGLPGMDLVEDEVTRGNLQLSCLGVGVNPYDGGLFFPLLAEFSSVEFLSKLETRIKTNWESSSERDQPSIEIRDLFDIKIDEWIQLGMIDNCSAVAVDLARAKMTDGAVTGHRK